MQDGDLCPWCESKVAINHDVPAPHYAMLQCTGEVPHFHGWVKAPRTQEWAANFAMPFGKYKNRTLSDIARSQSGQDYLRWAANTLEPGSASEAVKMFLGSQPK